MRAFHASRLVTEGTSGPTRPREDGRGACRSRRFVEKREGELERTASCGTTFSGGLMTKAAASKQCIPRHFRVLFCKSLRASLAADAP